MNIKLGSQITDNYRGDLIINSEYTSVVVKDENGHEISQGKKVLSLGNYTIEITPDDGYFLSKAKLNNKSIKINSSFVVNFGNNISIDAISDDAYTTDASLFMFNDAGLITDYIGEDENIVIPRTYSIGSVETIIGADLNYSYNWIWSNIISNGEDAIYDITLSNSTNSKTYATASELYNNLTTDFPTDAKLISFKAKEGSTGALWNIPRLLSYPVYFGEQQFNNYSELQSKMMSQPVDTLIEMIGYRSTFESGADYIVTGIADKAFQNCTILKNIDLSVCETLSTIGNFAFSGCSNISSITIPNNITNISNYAFQNCTNLTNVNMHDNLISIGDYAFSGCTSLTELNLPSSVTSIGSYAFNNCTGFKNITIPDTITSLGNYVFSGCSGLTDLYIPTSIISLTAGLLKNCTSLTNLTIPFVGTTGTATTYSTDTAFAILFSGTASSDLTYDARNYNNYSTTYYLPNSLTNLVVLGGNINQGAFYYCESLKSVDISACHVNSSNYLFDSCFDLENVLLPDSMLSLGERCFTSTNLTYLQLPSNLKTIGKHAIYCDHTIQRIIIPDGVTSIAVDAFGPCAKLDLIIVPATVKSIGANCFYRSAYEPEKPLNIYFYDLANITTFNPQTNQYADQRFLNSFFGIHEDNAVIYTASSSKSSVLPTEFNKLGNGSYAPIRYNYTYEEFIEAAGIENL